MKTNYIYIVLIVLVIGGLVVVRNVSDGRSSNIVTKFDDFALCLGEKGAKFYGAYWCPHCGDQKALFDKSAKLPYIECSTPDGKGQLQVCIDEKIQGYPTWKFADGSVVDRVMQLSELAEKTTCTVPTV